MSEGKREQQEEEAATIIQGEMRPEDACTHLVTARPEVWEALEQLGVIRRDRLGYVEGPGIHPQEPVETGQLSTGVSPEKPGGEKNFAAPFGIPRNFSTESSKRKRTGSKKQKELPGTEVLDDTGGSRGGAEWQEATRLSVLLLETLQDALQWVRDPGEKILTRWAVDIGKIASRDGHAFPVVEQVIRWIPTVSGKWWLGHVQSGESLRRHFGTLRAQMERSTSDGDERLSHEAIVDRARKL